MLTNQQISAIRMPVTTNILPSVYQSRRFERTFYRTGRQFNATLSVNFQTGDCTEYTPPVDALWHLTVTLVTNTGVKSPSAWNPRENEMARNVALDALAGAGIEAQEQVTITTAGYHLRRPLTESESQKLPSDLRASLTPTEE